LDIDFETGTVVTPDWLDRMQEINAGLAWNSTLQWTPGSATVSIPASSGNGAACLNIGGQMRLMETPLSVTFTVVSMPVTGTYNIFATTGSDDTDRSFALEARLTSDGNPGTSFYRNIGQVAWNASSAAITSVTPNTGVTYKHGHSHTPSQDPLPSDSVTTSMLQVSSVTNSKLAVDSVGTDKLQTNAVTGAKISTEAVTESKIGTAAVTNAKLGSDAVTREKIAAAMRPVFWFNWTPDLQNGQSTTWADFSTTPRASFFIPGPGILQVMWSGIMGFVNLGQPNGSGPGTRSVRFSPMTAFSGGSVDTTVGNYSGVSTGKTFWQLDQGFKWFPFALCGAFQYSTSGTKFLAAQYIIADGVASGNLYVQGGGPVSVTFIPA
jgi:hypothetical protein